MYSAHAPTGGMAPCRLRERKRTAGFTGLQVLAIVTLAIALTAGLTYWIARTYIWPADFEPVQLTHSEQLELDSKLRALGVDPPTPAAPPAAPPAVSAGRDSGGAWSGGEGNSARGEDAESAESWLRPEPYSEDPSRRNIALDERELNALLAHNTDLARRVAIDLADDLASARILIPVDPDFPILGGRTLRVAAGLELSYADDRPVVIVRGVSLMGVPVPNAWLGNLKNVDLVREFGGGPGAWKSFADGVEFVQIREGQVQIQLKP